jgi:hypothetical protein
MSILYRTHFIINFLSRINFVYSLEKIQIKFKNKNGGTGAKNGTIWN